MSIAQKTKTKRIRLNRASNGMLMTPEEFDAVTDYDDRFVYELIHGVLIVSPAPGESERDPNEELGFLFALPVSTILKARCLIRRWPNNTSRLPDSRRRADRVIWVGLGRVPNPQSDVPAIVAEFVSQRNATAFAITRKNDANTEAIGVVGVLGHRSV